MVRSGVRLEAWEGGGVPAGPALAGLERWGRPDMEETWRRRRARGGGEEAAAAMSARRAVRRAPSPLPGAPAPRGTPGRSWGRGGAGGACADVADVVMAGAVRGAGRGRAALCNPRVASRARLSAGVAGGREVAGLGWARGADTGLPRRRWAGGAACRPPCASPYARLTAGPQAGAGDRGDRTSSPPARVAVWPPAGGVTLDCTEDLRWGGGERPRGWGFRGVLGPAVASGFPQRSACAVPPGTWCPCGRLHRGLLESGE